VEWAVHWFNDVQFSVFFESVHVLLIVFQVPGDLPKFSAGYVRSANELISIFHMFFFPEIADYSANYSAFWMPKYQAYAYVIVYGEQVQLLAD
jgi:hypothetical protein